ncbi:MAG: OmpH family outer membrane protein [Proteobacteria bacterium]|nr:OmpH family outer membrane protein [Pseudomonadota bacterium]
MKKNIFMSLLFTVSFFLPLPVSAEETKLAYVDLQVALSTSNAGKSAKEMFQREVDRIQKDLDIKQNDLKRLKDELEKQGLLLSEETKVEKEREYQDKLKAVQRYYQDAQEELQGKDAELTRSVLINLRRIIVNIGQEKGYDMILERNESSVLYAKESADLTSEVIKRLNEAKAP